MAENEYFGKPCGLMDQMACSVGNMVYIDLIIRKIQLLISLMWILKIRIQPVHN